MEHLALAFGLALPWALGIALLLALDWPRSSAGDGDRSAGSAALRLGYGYFIGALALTLWMHALSATGVGFGRISIGAPLLVAVVALFAWATRRNRISIAAVRNATSALVRPQLTRWQQWAWMLLLAWLGLRFASIAAEIMWRPLYPWDAWGQWATKARVWFELGRIVPFARADVWLSGATAAYFDASPDNPSTVPLLQVWSCVALGRWDDSAMNWPWLCMLLALTLAVYGSLRSAGLSLLGALIGAYLVASLPLLDTHAALAGYADLMLAGVYTCAALALHRWVLRRDACDRALVLLLALACPLVETSGLVWALTLVPGGVVATFPRRGPKLVAFGFGAAALVVLAFARFEPALLGHSLHLDYQPRWHSLADAYLFFGNWHLLWYVVIVLAIIGARRLVRPPLAPLALIVASGLGVLFIAFAFPSATSVAQFGTANRATLPLAPLLTCLCVLLWRELTMPEVAPKPQAAQQRAGSDSVVAADA
ncbi:MAG: hypothetical protein E6H60_11120 [Betaproteobacteria bacterium]|nr:MAG: hypothetical protein E6H60_11120 [Betaproteobacteria bacterium]